MAKKRILIFDVNWLGDVLFSTSAIRNLRYNFPDSFIACIVPSSCYFILKGNPYLDEIILFDDKDRHKSLVGKLSFVQYLRRKKFDTVFLLHRSFSRALICRLAGIPERIGHYTKKRHFLLTKSIVPPERDSIHRIDYYLSVIEGAGVKVEDRFMDFFYSEEDAATADDFIKKNQIKKEDFLVVLNPGGNWLLKRWPIEYWAKLSDRVIAELGAKVILTFSYQDAKLAGEIKGLMKENAVIDCGCLKIKGLAALSKRLDVFVSADSGPLHIVNVSGARHIIALLGPSYATVTGTRPLKNVVILQKDVGCQVPCYILDCKDNRCMKAITVDEVFEKIKLYINHK